MGKDPQKPVIIISRTDKLGDLLLSFPAFYRAREIFPAARIIVLIRKYTADLMVGQSHIDRIICFDDYPFPQLVQELKQEHPDYFIALYTDPRVGKLARKCGAKHRIGPLSKLHSWLTYNAGIRQKRSQSRMHESAYNLELVNRLNRQKPSTTPYTRLFYGEENKGFIDEYLKQENIPFNAKLVLINPFTAGSAKNLEIAKYLEIGNQLLESSPEVWIIYCAIPANPIELLQQNPHPRQEVFVNTGSIMNFAALADKASLYIGPPTGTTHIASILSTPVVAIYPRIQNQAPKRWAPIGTGKLKIILPAVPCPQKYGCRRTCTHYDCYSTITAAEVVAAARELLQ